jgi:GNAT superfamily N-acetyltransferase
MAEGPCCYREWDSEFFGRRIAEVVGHRLSRDRAANVLAWSAEHAIDCLYFLADSDDAETVRIAEDHGFRLVDVRLTLARSITDEAPGGGTKPAGVRPAVPKDSPALKAVAATAYRDSRFHYDGHFPEARCEALYETWIEKSLNGFAEAVLVLDVDGRAGGYVSCHLRGGSVGQIGLIGVAGDLQGRGGGRRLVDASLIWFRDRGCREVIVVTQARNCQAQRLYQRAGFVTRLTQLWYHRWFDPSLP